jgi:MOSC domain-containing protein YiiM
VGLRGDEIRDTRHHGGRDKAVYAYAREDLDWWAAELGRDLSDGTFGENLTTTGVDVTGAVIGEHWQLGDDGLVLEVTYPRIPCKTFQGFMGERRWVRRFYAHGAPGAYLRVVIPGTVGAGDAIRVVHRPDHGVTIGEVFDLTTASTDRLRLLVKEADDLGVALSDAIGRILRARAR